MRADYGAWNSLGMSDADLRELADAAEHGAMSGGELSAGWSTGSGGGHRGLFVASAAERADYIGQSLARLLPTRALLRNQRIALHLRVGNALYSDAGRGHFAFSHLPLTADTVESAQWLADFGPTILIAPPHRLLAFARAGIVIPSLRHLFCGSEPISTAERAAITRHFGTPPRAIYQATEGFLGAECRAGRLHLNDHALDIELEPVAGSQGFRPVITDLRRHSQPIVRVRGDDYLEQTGEVCPCGYAGRIIRPVEGRVQDIWRFADRCVTPRHVVAAIEPVVGTSEWQAMATEKRVKLSLQTTVRADQAELAGGALENLTGRQVAAICDFAGWSGPKRRKVVWSDG